MQWWWLLRTALLFLFTTCVALALQPQDSNNHINNGPNFNSKHVPSQNSILREKRGYYKKPGFFRTLFSVIFEQWSDTKNTISKVSNLINDNFLPEDAPSQLMETSTAPSAANVSTTTPQYKIKRSELNRILQRNVKGIARLLGIELRDALRQSKRNYAEFKKNASIEVSKFL